MTSSKWGSRVHGLVTDTDGRVLLLPSEVGWKLPSVEVDIDVENDLRPAVEALEELLGARVTILRYAARDLDREHHIVNVVHVLECLAAGWEAPVGAEWRDRRSLSGLPLAIDAHREPVLHVLEELETGAVPAERAPWAREGWLAEATAWIETSLSALGRPPIGRVEQIRTWCLSSLLRVETADGGVFLKATAASPLFADEGSVMRGLAKLFPENVPPPLAVDSVRRWMLLADLGPELGWDAPLEVREEVLRVFARMQIQSAAHADDLLGLGCVDRRLEVLASEARDLLADDASLAGLDAEEVGKARVLGSKVDALCEALAESGMPHTLLHGDLHLSNVATIEGRHVFFDWSDASVGHPLFDLIDVFREESEAIHDQLRDVYLSAWVGTEPTDRLLDIWDLAQPLAFLHHAVSYRHILANVEPGSTQELEWALPYFLRKALAAMSACRSKSAGSG